MNSLAWTELGFRVLGLPAKERQSEGTGCLTVLLGSSGVALFLALKFLLDRVDLALPLLLSVRKIVFELAHPLGLGRGARLLLFLFFLGPCLLDLSFPH